jgi:hypothetical protein
MALYVGPEGSLQRTESCVVEASAGRSNDPQTAQRRGAVPGVLGAGGRRHLRRCCRGRRGRRQETGTRHLSAGARPAGPGAGRSHRHRGQPHRDAGGAGGGACGSGDALGLYGRRGFLRGGLGPARPDGLASAGAGGAGLAGRSRRRSLMSAVIDHGHEPPADVGCFRARARKRARRAAGARPLLTPRAFQPDVLRQAIDAPIKAPLRPRSAGRADRRPRASGHGYSRCAAGRTGRVSAPVRRLRPPSSP